ncbi:hypothetical protein JB92DRAFT_2828852 [Gautieria morchelliformis]|nr:hypothetical protein JB92DRAFT_2828852 [Gautieria morchelliformis]
MHFSTLVTFALVAAGAAASTILNAVPSKLQGLFKLSTTETLSCPLGFSICPEGICCSTGDACVNILVPFFVAGVSPESCNTVSTVATMASVAPPEASALRPGNV